jgi:tetratricopeptide (TPR) repeat protein
VRLTILAPTLVLLAVAVPAAAMPTGGELAEAWRLLDTYQVARGRDILDRALAQDPANPTAVYLRALAAFYEGRYDEAVERLAKAETSALSRGGEDLPRIFADTAAATANLTPYRGEHFTLLLDDRKDWILARPALEALERCYSVLGDYFGVRPGEPVRVEIYSRAEDFQKVSSLTVRDIENSGAIGICKFNKIMMLSPRALAYGYRWVDTLAHEYLHYLLVRLTANQAPIWVQEGVASYLEAAWKTGKPQATGHTGGALLAQAMEDGTLVPFDRMDPSLVRLDTPREVSLAFAECATAVDFIVARAGADGLRAFLRRIGELPRGRTRDALQETIGLDFPAFEEAWKRHVAGMGLRAIKNLRVDQHRLAREGSDEEFLADIGSLAARNHLSLGDRLRQGGRLKPALVEYQRACREDPDSVYLLNKVAIAALLLEDFPLAAEYAGRALEIGPDYPLTHLTLGDLALRRNEPLAAIARFDEYNEINPFNPRVWLQKGRAHLGAGERDRARSAWETGLRLAPDDSQFRLELDRLDREPG